MVEIQCLILKCNMTEPQLPRPLFHPHPGVLQNLRPRSEKRALCKTSAHNKSCWLCPFNNGFADSALGTLKSFDVRSIYIWATEEQLPTETYTQKHQGGNSSSAKIIKKFLQRMKNDSASIRVN